MVEKKVLIADDATFMRKMIKDVLTKEGFKVVGEAENGEEAVELYKKFNPDLVTMDINMPGKDGIAAIEEILNEDQQAQILICSAIAELSTVSDVIGLGAKEFVAKPFQPKTILKAVNGIFD
nr:response regulator [Sporohalobacter salinus]